MGYSYEIGTTTDNRINVKQLGAATLTHEWQRVEPYGMTYQPFSVLRVAASGKEYGDGYPTAEWQFDTIHPAQLDALLDYIGDGNQSAAVHIKTRLADGTYGTFSAIMHRPKNTEDMNYVLEKWHDVRIRFTCLVAE